MTEEQKQTRKDVDQVAEPSGQEEKITTDNASEEAMRPKEELGENLENLVEEDAGDGRTKARSIRDIAIDFIKPFRIEATTDEDLESEAISEEKTPMGKNTDEIDKASENVSIEEALLEEEPELSEEEKEEERQERARIHAEELEAALEAAGMNPQLSTCEELRHLADELENGPAPLLKKDHVVIERRPALELINGLTALCEARPGEDFEDELFDALAASDHEGSSDFKPMYRVKSRAQTIIDEAMAQADLIVNDARLLSNQLLRDTDAKIQSKYNQADDEIEARIETAKEASIKNLTEAREELTASRKQSVDILNLYMDKAEDDYQGYWERAEQTLFAAMLKSESVLSKGCEIYERELAVIREDIESIEDILEKLARTRL